MKKIASALLFSLLAVLLMGAAASTSLVYVDTTSRALTGNIVAGNNTTISASGNGTITATAAPLSGLSGLGTGVGTFLATPSSANLASAVTNETGSGALVFATSPTLVTPVLGAATGTSLALSGNGTASDYILGTSGPSVKSSLGARAPRQGLVFDGTAIAGTVSPFTAIGSTDFTAAIWARLDSVPNYAELFSSNVTSSGFSFWVTSNQIGVQKKSVADVGNVSDSFAAGKWALYVYTKNGSTGTIYKNGIQIGSTLTDNQNYTATQISVGGDIDYKFTGAIASPLIYNRALSAAEVVALYEAGAPAGNDYPGTAAGTAIQNQSASNESGLTSFSSSNGQFSGTTNGTGTFYVRFSTGKINAGNLFRITGTISYGGAYPLFGGVTQQGSGSGGAAIPVTNGNLDVVITAHSYQASGLIDFYIGGVNGVSWTVNNLVITPLGLLLAPDAQQVGGGIVWADTSGNAAHITLPASGVAWNVPSQIGEYVENSVAYASRVSLTNNVAGNVVSLALTAGDWDVSGTLAFSLNSATVTGMSGGISSTSATLGGLGTYSQNPGLTTTASAQFYQPTPTVRVSLTSATTVYLVGYSLFSAGTVDGFGHIRARRVR